MASADSKKPKVKGKNSASAIAEMAGLRFSVGAIARACDSMFKDIRSILIKTPITETNKAFDELERFPVSDFPFDETSREVKCSETSQLKKYQVALDKHYRVLENALKALRPRNKKKAFKPKAKNDNNSYRSKKQG